MPHPLLLILHRLDISHTTTTAREAGKCSPVHHPEEESGQCGLLNSCRHLFSHFPNVFYPLKFSWSWTSPGSTLNSHTHDALH